MAWYKITYDVVVTRQALLNGKDFHHAMDSFVKGELIQDKKVRGVRVARMLTTVAEIQPNDYPDYNIPCIVTEGG